MYFLVEQGVDLIFINRVGATKSAQAVTRQIPIVFTTVDNPIVLDLIKSYAQPGGNTTGVIERGLQLGPKRLQLFSEMIPGLKRVLFPYNATDTVALIMSPATLLR